MSDDILTLENLQKVADEINANYDLDEDIDTDTDEEGTIKQLKEVSTQFEDGDTLSNESCIILAALEIELPESMLIEDEDNDSDDKEDEDDNGDDDSNADTNEATVDTPTDTELPKDVSRSELQAVCKELNETLGLSPKIKVVGAKKEDVLAAIDKVIRSGVNTTKLSKETKKFLSQFTISPGSKPTLVAKAEKKVEKVEKPKKEKVEKPKKETTETPAKVDKSKKEKAPKAVKVEKPKKASGGKGSRRGANKERNEFIVKLVTAGKWS